MPRLSPTWLAAQSEFGVDTAARLCGVPEPTLRLHVDQGKLMGVRRLPGGKRLINREGLLAYLKARGFETSGLEALERRGAPRIRAHLTHVHMTVQNPDIETQLGYGQGVMIDYSDTGFKAEKILWEGFLPALDEPLSFRILDGRLRQAQGKVRLSWLHFQDDELRMGLRDLRLDDGGPQTVSGFLTRISPMKTDADPA